MAFGYYLNFEKLDQKIIQEAIENLSESVTFEVDYEKLNEAFVNNLHYGSIAIIFIVNLYETALNTIISKRLNWMEEEILKLSHSIKLKIICYRYNVDYLQIKSDHRYGILREIIKLRNDITHYKTNEICEGSYVGIEAKIPMGSTKKLLQNFLPKVI